MHKSGGLPQGPQLSSPFQTSPFQTRAPALPITARLGTARMPFEGSCPDGAESTSTLDCPAHNARLQTLAISTSERVHNRALHTNILHVCVHTCGPACIGVLFSNTSTQTLPGLGCGIALISTPNP